MTDPDYVRRSGPGEARRAGGRTLRQALVLTTASVIVFAASIIALRRGRLSTTTAELTAVVTLAAFGFTVYGLLRTLLVLIESAGERRRQQRAATERRQAGRVRKPD